MNKVLINTPHLSLPGGVSNHYKGLAPFFGKEIRYNQVGRRPLIPSYLALPFDYIKFTFLCVFGKYRTVVLNPSLGERAIKRDALFLKISSLLKKRTIVFFHGWDKEYEIIIDENPSFFYKRYKNTDDFIVLANDFKNKLKSWGIQSKVWLSTTKVNDQLLENFNCHNRTRINSILFLARIEASKGIFITLDSFKLLLNDFPDFKLQIAGDGSALNQAKEYVKTEKIKNVHFLGNLNGTRLVSAFEGSDLYMLPTSHGEGMPTSVLEAMAFGLPVITRPVGGLKDFFEDHKMGYLIEGKDPSEFYLQSCSLIKDLKKFNRIRQFNHQYATKHFLASKVSQQLETIFR